MSLDRELIFSTLFTAVSGANGILTASRKFRGFDDIQPEFCPALFMVESPEEGVEQRKGLPPKYTLSAEIFLRIHTGDEEESPATALNELITAVEDTLAPDISTNVNNLGLDNVSHCWIVGPILKFPAYVGNKGAAIITVNILAT